MHFPALYRGTPMRALISGKTVYVVNNGSGTVTPISTATNAASKPINVGLAPVSIAITP
jgi:YVTN family beta-propeller protein